jgi:plasmid segregation protein ParM
VVLLFLCKKVTPERVTTMDVGFDGGFYATKAISGKRIACFASLAVRPAESQFSLNGHQAIIITSPHGRFLCGAEAVKKGVTGARKETAGWIETPEYMSLFLGALSELTDGTQATINLVTGLPLADYRRDRAKLRDRLLGVHQFVREGRRGQSLTVETVRVVPQAWGAVLALLPDDRGQIVRPELHQQKVGVLDVGGHTVNYLSVDGLSDIPAETRGTERGAWHVVRVVRDYLASTHPGLLRLNDHDLMQAIIARQAWDADEPVDLTPVVREIVDDIRQEIVDTAAQYWAARAATMRQVIVCGGGAHLWGDHVKRAFRQAVVVEQPELANARGFYRFAANLSQVG